MRTALATLLLFAATSVFAAIALPEASPGTTVVQEIGTSKVTVVYHRPAVKGRKVWGELVPVGKVWRLGANNATTIELSHDAKIAGQNVPAGKYAMFAIPGESEWTLILNKEANQWGAYFYKQENDLLRFPVKPQVAEFQEWFDIDLAPVSERAVRFDMRWERVRVPFTIEFDVNAIVWKDIDQAIATAAATDWETFHQAARYALNTNQRLDQAMTWIDKAMAARESFWNYELKALLLHKAGRTEEAYPLMEKAKQLATGKAPQEYVEGLDKTVAEWRKGATK